MPFEITMPQLGLTMESGTVLRWLVHEGEPFVKGQEILEVETDKAAVAVEAHEAGRLARVLVEPGDEVPIGSALALAVAPGESLPEDWERPPDGRSTTETRHPPALSGSGRDSQAAEQLTASWKARALAREMAIDLTTVPGSGPGGRVVAADVLAAQPLGTTDAPPTAGPEEAAVSPVAARLAESLGLETSRIKGSGPNGQIMRPDVIAAAARRIASGEASERGRPVERPRVSERRPLAGVRAVVSERMAVSARTTARVTLFRDVHAGALIDLREQYRQRGTAASYNDLLVRICAAALREHPEANARMGDGAIEVLEDIHVGLAVDTDEGLLVPVIHNVDGLTIPQIARESTRLIEAARAGRCTPDELTGGTFTVTNLGMLGVEGFTPVINLPECCILGVGRIVRKAVVDEHDQVVARSMMMLSLAFDHRVIDGAPAARFLDRIVELVEEPRLLL